jgi:type IV pilus assembly protein PilP
MMSLLRYTIYSFLILFFSLQGCSGGGEATAPTNQPKTAAPAKPEQKQVASIPQSPEPPTAPKLETENFAYDPAGRPDPFKSILLTGTAKGQQFISPLQQREVTEMKLIAVVWGGLGQSAMLQTPDGKGYTIRVGTRVGPNQGVVKKITPREVVVEERYTDVFGETRTREIILELRLSGERTE